LTSALVFIRVCITSYTIDIDNEDYSQFIEDTSQLPILNQNGELVIEEQPEDQEEDG
jgi:hypothetical protein